MPLEHEPVGPQKGAAEAARLWRIVRRQGMDQRRFLQLFSFGSAAAVLAACTGLGGRRVTPAASETGDAKAWFKDTTPFVVHDDGKSLEARLENMEGLITPNHLFFVRNNSVSLDVDVANWRLSVDGRCGDDSVGAVLRRYAEAATAYSRLLPGMRRQSAGYVRFG